MDSLSVFLPVFEVSGPQFRQVFELNEDTVLVKEESSNTVKYQMDLFDWWRKWARMQKMWFGRHDPFLGPEVEVWNMVRKCSLTQVRKFILYGTGKAKFQIQQAGLVENLLVELPDLENTKRIELWLNFEKMTRGAAMLPFVTGEFTELSIEGFEYWVEC